MSHNKIKVGTATPDVNGDIALSVTDIISGTPSAGDTIQYNGSIWESVALSNFDFLYISTNTADAYSNSGATSVSSGDDWYFYGDNIVNNIGATITKYSTTDWVQSITLPAGKYILRSATFAEFSASGFLRIRWVELTTARSNTSIIGDNLSTFGGSSSTCFGYFTTTSSITINAEIVSASNVDTVANQGNTPSEYNYVLIMKVA